MIAVATSGDGLYLVDLIYQVWKMRLTRCIHLLRAVFGDFSSMIVLPEDHLIAGKEEGISSCWGGRRCSHDD